MLKYAKLYENELKQLFTEIAFDFHYKYAFVNVYRDELKLPESTWEGHTFVSLHEEKIIGYIRYTICRQAGIVSGFQILSFQKEFPYTFSKDVATAIDDIFNRYGFHKLNFGVVIGNPIEKCYDRLIKRAGGRIVGVQEKEVRLIDGKYYDYKLYEIMAANYPKEMMNGNKTD